MAIPYDVARVICLAYELKEATGKLLNEDYERRATDEKFECIHDCHVICDETYNELCSEYDEPTFVSPEGDE